MKVAIIGGGAAGLCAARKCHEASFHVTLFEASRSIGGTWVFTSDVNVHSSMYENLRTNLPKEIMAFNDLKFPPHLPSFLSHTDVLDYLRKYSEPIRQFIKLGCAVKKVSRDNEQWRIDYLYENLTTYDIFDVVFVCNGHYTKSYIPQISGSFEGTVIHSHDYRNPTPYKDQKVAVIGAGASGVDITLQLADVAEKVYLLSDKEPLRCILPTNVIQCSTIRHFDADQLYLQDGSIIRVDSVIFSTGYLYSCDFLDDLIKPRFNGKMLSPTFLHVSHIRYPTSLFFIGLNTIVIPFTLFEYQINFALAMISGNAQVTQQQISEWENRRLSDLESSGIDGSMFHRLGDTQWDYFEQLRLAASSSMSGVSPIVRSIYEDTSKRRRENVMRYKNFNYQIDGDTFTVC
uniref:Flavin-containing monooxygenase n=2 Tax=Parascaris univalens TaxID=6257 RepID=A0A914ZQT2_PARUN